MTNSGASSNPEMRLVVDRQRLADLGLSARQVATAARTAVEGTVVTTLRPEDGDEVDIRLMAADTARADLAALADIPITAIRDGQPALARHYIAERLVLKAASRWGRRLEVRAQGGDIHAHG